VTRDYPHQPVLKTLLSRYQQHLYTRLVSDQKEIDQPVVQTALSHLFAANDWLRLAGLAFGLDESPATVQSYLANAASRFQHSIATGQMSAANARKAKWISVALMTGRTDLIDAIATFPQPDATDPKGRQPAYLLVDAMIALHRNDTATALHHAQELSEKLSSWQCHRDTRRYFASTYMIVTTIINRDQEGFNAAISERTAQHIARFRTRDGRHDFEGLLDFVLTGLALQATQHGLVIPDTPYVKGILKGR
jgi:hypothetical protein